MNINSYFINKIIIENNKTEIFNLCETNSIINYVASDFEIYFPKGYSIQYSASKLNNFAKPYPSCNVTPKEKFEYKNNWECDFSFQGDQRPTIRPVFLMLFIDYLLKRPKVKHKIVKNETQFSNYTENQKKEINTKNEYEKTVNETKFVLCPMGSGLQSIRFFETLAANNIPIYIGDKRTKFPLDWIIDWEKICFRLDENDLYKGYYIKKLDKIMSMGIEEVNNMRKYINEIYNNYLLQNDENIKKFESLVKKRIEEILSAGIST